MNEIVVRKDDSLARAAESGEEGTKNGEERLYADNHDPGSYFRMADADQGAAGE